MQVRLVIVGGRASKSEVPLELPAIIGRSPTAALTIPHPLVSRQHCMLFESEGVVMLRDLDSLNGTFLGSERIGEILLRPGESFSIGPLAFRCEYEPTGRLPALPPKRSANVAAEENASPWAGGVSPQGIPSPPPTGAKPPATDPYDEDLLDFLREEPS